MPDIIWTELQDNKTPSREKTFISVQNVSAEESNRGLASRGHYNTLIEVGNDKNCIKRI